METLRETTTAESASEPFDPSIQSITATTTLNVGMVYEFREIAAYPGIQFEFVRTVNTNDDWGSNEKDWRSDYFADNLPYIFFVGSDKVLNIHLVKLCLRNDEVFRFLNY